MAIPSALQTRSELFVRRPLPGLVVVRSTGDRPLMRYVPAHYGTTLQLAGHSRWTSGGEDWASGPGSVGIKIPGEVAVERAREGGVAFQSVLFEWALFDEARSRLDSPRAELVQHAIDPRDPRVQPLRSLHRQLLHEETGPELEELVCDALHALVDMTLTGRTGPSRFTAAVARARALLDAHFTEDIGLEALATHARADKFRLCRAFREQVGLPPHAYVTHRRVVFAQELLARGMPQAEAAAKAGFYDQSLMHRHFKRILRMTPGDFARAAVAPRKLRGQRSPEITLARAGRC